MYKKIKILSLVFVLFTSVAHAQVSDFTKVVKEQLVNDWIRARLYTSEILTAMPAEKYTFKPEKDAMDFKTQLLHLAKYNFNLGSAATGVDNPFKGHDIQKEKISLSKDSIDVLVLQSYDFLIDGLKKLDANKLAEKSGGMTCFLTLEKAFEHQTHHRGGLVVYMRIAGIIPPHERLF